MTTVTFNRHTPGAFALAAVAALCALCTLAPSPARAADDGHTAIVGAPPAAAAPAAVDAALSRGRYLARIGGCNDCHTPGYGPSQGQVDERRWLTGDVVGYSGPWGTTYATNLRLWMRERSEDEWLHAARHGRPRPPMPWFNLRAMTDADLRALYRYVVSLGPAGDPAPAYLPPGQSPQGPVVRFP